MAKPFSIQSPEDIAKEYAGNKQKIAQAMQMGIVDATAGVLAGMFIDRMRSAQVQEGVNPPTVAQQVMGGAPPAPANPLPAGGLGGTSPAGAPSMAPPPPMGMPPEMGMAPPMGMSMPEAPPMGMADGGLASLPVPDTMFDEPSNGGFDDGYAGGGIVAFAGAGPVKGDAGADMVEEEDEEVELGPEGEVGHQLLVLGNRNKPPKTMEGVMYQAPRILGGLSANPFYNADTLSDLAPRETKRAKELEAILERERSPEERAKRKKEDMWMALAQLGAKMATTPGTLLQAAGAGISEALPGAAAAAKERRTEERALTKELLAEERTANRELETRAGVALDMLKQYNTLEQAFQDRNFNNTLTRLGINADIVKAKIMAGASIESAMLAAAASRFGSTLGYNERRGVLAGQFAESFDATASANPVLKALSIKDPEAFAAKRDTYISENVDRYMPALGSDGGFRSATPTLPPGFKPD